MLQLHICSGLPAHRCKPKKCKQECKRFCPVVKIGKMCIEVTSNDRIAWISEDLCIGCGICVKVRLIVNAAARSTPLHFCQALIHSLRLRRCNAAGHGSRQLIANCRRSGCTRFCVRTSQQHMGCCARLNVVPPAAPSLPGYPGCALHAMYICLCIRLPQKCPFDAIMIINLPKDLERETTHRYGPNSFKLHRSGRMQHVVRGAGPGSAWGSSCIWCLLMYYGSGVMWCGRGRLLQLLVLAESAEQEPPAPHRCRLPMPRPGQVLGLVGSNGTGKSTALKILAGKLKPNLGRFADVSQQGSGMLRDGTRGCVFVKRAPA